MFKSIALLLTILVQQIAGHGYCYTPRTRNWVAVEEGVNGAAIANLPPKEYCPDCLNTNEEGGICGKKNGGTSYTDYRDSVGNEMPWQSQDIFTAGDTITVKHHYTTHHYGHISLSVCPDGDSSTQSCFDNPDNWLEFVSDELYGMPKDDAYPERGYLKRMPVPVNFDMKFKLPPTVHGDQVLLQWRYITANSCIPDGYATYFQNAIADPNLNVITEDWKGANMAPCTAYPQDGSKPTGAPEQFWNCAELTILPAFPTASPQPTTTPYPTGTPTVKPPPQTYPPNSSGIPFPCCAWNVNDGCTQPDNDYCHASKNQCESACSGTFLEPSDGTPAPVGSTTPAPVIVGTPAPVSTVTPAPVVVSTPAPVSPTGGGTSNGIPLPCCGWSGEGCSQPENGYCQANSNQCSGACSGQWYTEGSPINPAPASAPPSGGGCCTWGGWSTCPSWTENSSDPCHSVSSACTGCSGTWIDSGPNNRKLRGAE